MRAFVRASVMASAAALAIATTPDVFTQERTILRAEVSGAITPVVAGYLQEAVSRAEREGHQALLVQLDTPGGLDSAMRDIVRTFFASRVPVIVWTAPSGARAASAGAIMAYAAHVSAMAPGTNIGAATPVGPEGGEVGDKITNDAVAYSVAIAEERGRDVGFAREMVRDGRSEPASAAVEIGAADLLAADLSELLSGIDGREVEIAGEVSVIQATGVSIVEHEMGFVDGVRQRLADPNLALLFMSLGTLAIIYELANPGMGFGGIAGVILLLLAMFSIAVLPINVVGVMFLILAVGLFVAELFVPGVGVMAGGGAVSLVLAGLFLVEGGLRVDLAVLLPTALVMTGATVFAGRLAWRTRRARPTTGADPFQGKVAEVRRVDGRRGQIFIEGSWWSVQSESPLEEGRQVRVTAVEGLTLMVEPTDEPREEERA